MIQIREYEEMFAESISQIVTQNLLEVNSKDYGMEYAQKTAQEFTPSEIKRNFSQRTKVFVAMENDVVVGTAGLDKSWYNDDGEYYILTVFVDINHHKKGIGRLLIEEVEKYAKQINAKRLVIPASINGCEFYHKLGYEYENNEKKLNEEKMYIMDKYLR